MIMLIYYNFLFLLFLISKVENKECLVPENKIFRGDVVNFKMGGFPFTQQLRLWEDQICGCSFFKKQYILTAASCFDSERNPYAFDTLFRSKKANRGGEKHKIARIIIHHKYNAQILDYNIAIAILEYPILKIYSDGRPVHLSPYPPPRGTVVWTAGWGLVRKGRYARSLRYLMAKIVDISKCAPYGNITERMICAKYKHSDQNVGLGDSGGPLVSYGFDGIQYGIASWGSSHQSVCFGAQAYTNLADYEIKDFIRRTSG